MTDATATRLPTGTVTFLFSDIEGSTRLLTALGDRWPPILEAHSEILRSAIGAHDGTVVSTEGDSFFAVFPSAMEAVGAAADIQRGLAAHQWPTGSDVSVRIGIHTGEGRLGADNYVGSGRPSGGANRGGRPRRPGRPVGHHSGAHRSGTRSGTVVV